MWANVERIGQMGFHQVVEMFSDVRVRHLVLSDGVVAVFGFCQLANEEVILLESLLCMKIVVFMTTQYLEFNSAT